MMSYTKYNGLNKLSIIAVNIFIVDIKPNIYFILFMYSAARIAYFIIF